jgi:hypothetical protein
MRQSTKSVRVERCEANRDNVKYLLSFEIISAFYAGRAILVKWQKLEINTGKGFAVFDLPKCEQIVHIFRALTILVISKKFQKLNKRTI